MTRHKYGQTSDPTDEPASEAPLAAALPLAEVPPDRREPDVAPVQLVQDALGKDDNPRDRPIPAAPVAAPDPAPRLVHENERAPAGLRRYKAWSRQGNRGAPRTRYILARNADEARAYYLQSTGLDHDIAAAKRQAQLAAYETFPAEEEESARNRLMLANLEKIPRPEVTVKELAD